MKKIITLLLSFAIAVVFCACNNPQKNSSDTISTTSTLVNTYSELSSVEESFSDISDNAATSTPAEAQTSTQTPTVSKTEPVSSTLPTTSTSTDTTGNTSSTTSSTDTRKFVQPADTKTGISWDGVSPIIYTYPDGTTGTEKRDGATYEQVPGLIATVNLAAENYVSDYDGTCSHCGKEEGTGVNGTCIRPLGDMICTGCGEHLSKNVCHTCDE